MMNGAGDRVDPHPDFDAPVGRLAIWPACADDEDGEP